MKTRADDTAVRIAYTYSYCMYHVNTNTMKTHRRQTTGLHTQIVTLAYQYTLAQNELLSCGGSVHIVIAHTSIRQ